MTAYLVSLALIGLAVIVLWEVCRDYSVHSPSEARLRADGLSDDRIPLGRG